VYTGAGIPAFRVWTLQAKGQKVEEPDFTKVLHVFTLTTVLRIFIVESSFLYAKNLGFEEFIC
jgi:hypothetical protein